MKRFITWMVTGALVLTLAVSLFAYGHVHAQASTPTCDGQTGYQYCQSFNFNWTFPSTVKDPGGLGGTITVDYYLSGHIGYNTHGAKGGAQWTNQTILDPVFKADVYLCVPQACVADTVSYLDMTQYWDGYACGFNPSFSLSVPWGISLSGWPTCGDRSLAARVLPIPYGYGHEDVENNSHYPVPIGDYFGTTSSPPCYGVVISSTIEEPTHVGHSTDAFRSTNRREVCLPVAG